MIDDIKQTILDALPDATVYVADPNQDGEHFEAIVISKHFETLPLVRQHQCVMKALKEKFETSVHALALKTFTPEKWKKEKPSFFQLPD